MSKYKLDKLAQIVENSNYIMTQEEVCERLNQQSQRIAELEEQLKKSLESNNDLLKQIMDLQSQLIIERLKG